MPTVSVGRDRLFSALRKSYCKQWLHFPPFSLFESFVDLIVLYCIVAQEEFEDLCFKFGIELDDVTTEKAIIRKERHLDDEEDGGVGDDDEEIIYKIEVPANRYDLLCLEGIAQALRVFNEEQQTPTYTLAGIPKDSMLKMHVKPQTSSIRPFVVCAVLRDITFDEASYNSFIDLQDKLHQNICRRRTLVAIGTHDLDTLQGPFTYEALSPKSINFVPLKQEKSFRADELMEFYKSDMKLKKFLHIIENSPVFPVIYDSKRLLVDTFHLIIITVLSLPPIINGAHSAITLKTKNVFIECTATDLTKANIVLNTVVTTFSAYCQRKFEVEPVEVIYSDGRSFVYPDLSVYNMEVPLSYITGTIGVSLEAEKVTSLLNRMQLRAEHSVLDDNNCNINVLIPPTRSDILHPCDVMEDVAIAYGYNGIPKRRLPSMKPLPLNQLEDLIREEIAMNGFTEVLTWILCSNRENFALLNREDDQSSAVIIGNPRSSDFEVIIHYESLRVLGLGMRGFQTGVPKWAESNFLNCYVGSYAVRTSLMPGALKIIGHNKDHPKPIKIFEVGDVALLDESKDVGATNRRHLAALYCGTNSGFELIHSLMDRIMEVLGTPFVPIGDNTGYYIQRSDAPEFLPGRQASIIYKGKHIGDFGIVHPQVLSNFVITDPCSFLEIDIEHFL
ncbi:hypothetical protein DKX38_019720 [Salix brachista]|uniref:phenylalanine--tRNA ligase n=1 Tax=Salix brachista TaxID=2182728 RepID=A0A5N5KH11_9ROSI|nr:hypothetical protein DKX38_019720 [Salix brachista]